MKIAVLLPSQDTVSAGFAYDLARLFGSNGGLTIFNVRGTYIPQQRATLVNAALDAGATHMLWIDSDMRFPPNGLIRLLEHQHPIVATNYPTRRAPILPTAEHNMEGSLFTNPDDTGLVEVSHCGMGFMLVDAEVYKNIGEPYFALGWNPTTKDYAGEDIYFCEKARKHGYKIMIDQELSQEIRHVGEMEYRAEHALMTRDIYNKREPLIVV